MEPGRQAQTARPFTSVHCALNPQRGSSRGRLQGELELGTLDKKQIELLNFIVFIKIYSFQIHLPQSTPADIMTARLPKIRNRTIFIEEAKALQISPE